MIIFDTVIIALRSLWANKARSLLTMLGIIIGVLSVIQLLAIGEGVRGAVAKQIEDFGSNLLIIVPGKVDAGKGFNFAAQVGKSPLTVSDVQAIKDQVSEVKTSSALKALSGEVKHDQTPSPQTFIFGTTPDAQSAFSVEIGSGSFITTQDVTDKKSVAVIGSVTARTLFGDSDPLGKQITVLGQTFDIVGVTKQKAGSSALQFGPSLDDVVFMPMSVAQDISKSDDVLRILTQVADAKEMDQAKSDIKSLLISRHNGQEDFSILTQDDILSLFDSVLGILTKMLSGIAALSLLVGGIGIMNIMLVSVTERTREIGLRKAVGATELVIMSQFLVESILLCVVGGAIGVGLAYGISAILTSKFNLPAVVTPQAVLLAFGVSVGVGIVFGIAPAITAARKDPIVSLRYE